jgi:hypothetical protein
MGLLYLMFSTGRESVRKEGLFGSLFFEAREAPGGATDVSMGLANPTGLVVIFGLLCVVLAVTQVVYQELSLHRKKLISERADARR